ncbi:MAG: hypothetical protein IPM69_08475 [Ignavibacteria bacterium]|nr:hypothetical protein [Ignavibacteria bacterium]
MYSIIINLYFLRLAHYKIALTLTILFFVLFTSKSSSQITGAPLPGDSIDDDTTIVFTSPRPLLAEQQALHSVKHGWGLDVIFSSNGFRSRCVLSTYIFR